MSSIAMAADSTQADSLRRKKYTVEKRPVAMDRQTKPRTNKQSTTRRTKKEQSSSSSSSTDSSSDDDSLNNSSRDRMKRRNKMKRSRANKDDSCSDHDSDLDLSKELLPIGGYESDCEKMVEHMFRSISMKKLRAMLPEIMKPIGIAELKQLCIKQLDCMSKKRISRILDGDDPENISSSEAEDDVMGQKRSKDLHMSSDSTANQASATSIDKSIDDMMPCCSHADGVTEPANDVEMKATSVNMQSTVDDDICSLPSLDSEPEDTCTPFKHDPCADSASALSCSNVAAADGAVSSRLGVVDEVKQTTAVLVSATASEPTAELKSAASLEQTTSMTTTASNTSTSFSQQGYIDGAAQANAENENNMNVEVENDRNTLGRGTAGVRNSDTSPREILVLVDDNISTSRMNSLSRQTVTDTVLQSHSGMTDRGMASTVSVVTAGCDVDEMIIDVHEEQHAFSDDDEEDPRSPRRTTSSSVQRNSVAESTRRNDRVGSSKHDVRTTKHSQVDGNRNRSWGHSRRRSADRRLESPRHSHAGGGGNVLHRSGGTDRNERRRSADDARDAVAVKTQRLSHQTDRHAASNVDRKFESRSDTAPLTSGQTGSSSDDSTRPRSVVSAPAASLLTSSDARQETATTTVKRISIKRPVVTSDTIDVQTKSATMCSDGGTELKAVTPVESTEAGSRSQKVRQTAAAADKSLSPEALSKTQLEILELEMRARAIKAMLRAQEELEIKEMSKRRDHSSKSSRQQYFGGVPGPRSRVSEVHHGGGGGAVSRKSLPLTVYRSGLPISGRIVQRHRIISEIVARKQRQRQFAMRDRLARFCPQALPVISRSDARLKLNAVQFARRVVTSKSAPTRRTATTSSSSVMSRRVVRVTSHRVSEQTPMLSTTTDTHHRVKRAADHTTRSVTSSSSRQDVRRVFVTSPTRRLVTMTSSQAGHNNGTSSVGSKTGSASRQAQRTIR